MVVARERLRWLRRPLIVALAAWLVAAVGFVLLDLAFPFPFHRIERPPAVTVTDRAGEPLRRFLPADGRWRLPVTLDEISPAVVKTLLSSEDRRFYRHPGVDPRAVVRAAATNLRRRAVVSGASTLPMQIARMAEPRPRTLGAKVVEAFRALQLDAHRTKDQQLELYLNLAPYGGNLEGVGAAAAFLFSKAPDEISLGEAALLTALPRSPVRYDPTRYPEIALKARNLVLDQLADRGTLEPKDVVDARFQALPRRHRPAPFAAPHATRWLAARNPGRAVVESSLDPRLQAVAEARLAARLGELRSAGLDQAAVVVIENLPGGDGLPEGRRAVRALVGSAGFFEEGYAGQVNGALARRSPGSTLKPWIYALAMDSGLAVPGSRLLDVPTDFAGYVAENYDGRYRGPVSLRRALVESLNAPAVRLTARVGTADFLRLLRRAGLSTLDRPASEYGLPLVLGAGEVTLLELTNAYATLAAGGLHRSASWADDARVEVELDRLPPPERLLSPEAAYLVAEILAQVERPDLPEAWDLTRDVPAVAWKTGTSFGHRDAWAVGFSERFTLGVWVGNFDGRAQKGISGSTHAGPLLFDLFRAIEGRGARLARPRGLRIETLELCAESRQLPHPYCPHRQEVTYLPGKTRLGPCPIHRRATVDAEGALVTADCTGAGPRRSVVLTVDDPELTAFRLAQGEATAAPTPVSSSCSGVPGGEAPAVVSPDPATPYRLRRDAPVEFQQIALIARASPHARRLFWYVDGRLVAEGPPGAELFWPPRRGRHDLVVVDDTGRSASVRFQVL